MRQHPQLREWKEVCQAQGEVKVFGTVTMVCGLVNQLGGCKNITFLLGEAGEIV